MAASEIILVFASNNQVLNAEDLLEDLGFEFELIPVPKEVNPNCGLALSFSPHLKQPIMAALNGAAITAISIYLRGDHGFSAYNDATV
ncbi:MAG: DUF3343 domain-containing protein [Candidatus Adiutrix sp.]